MDSKLTKAVLLAPVYMLAATGIVLACITPGGKAGKGLRPNTTLTYFISDNMACPGSVDSAFLKWTNKNNTNGGNGVTFRPWNPSTDGPTPNVYVLDQDLGAFSTTGGSTTVGRDSEAYITGGSIRVNSNNAANSTCDGYLKTMLHEIGHMSNLRDASDGGGSTVMNQFAGANDAGGNLPTDVTDCDRNAANNQSIKGRLAGESDEEYHLRCAGDEENCDPIILDLDGARIRLSPPEVWFDIGATGEPVMLSWTVSGAREGFLGLDRNHDGAISDGRELFGDVTPLSWTLDGPRARQGFEALAFFDRPENGGNGDGMIDRNDRVFSDLLVWIDENHDGLSQATELTNLEAVGVIRIVCVPKEWSRRDANGNVFGFRAPMVMETARGHVMRYAYDAFLVAK